MFERILDFLDGLLFSLRYKLGLAREGVHFFPSSSEPVKVQYWDDVDCSFRVVSFNLPICIFVKRSHDSVKRSHDSVR